MSFSPPRRPGARLLSALAAGGLVLAGCAGQPEGAQRSSAAPEAATTTSGAERAPREASGPSPRLVATYDGGILTLDASTLSVVGDTPLEGFNRVNPLGDGRGVLVSTQDGFRVFDTGAWTEPHGDHTHSYVADPHLTDMTYTAEKPGHVVHGDDRTLVFGDGDGSIQELPTSGFRGAYSSGTTPGATSTRSVTPHHGVAVPLPGGGMLRTEGTTEERHTVVVEDGAGAEIARSGECPGVHGEAVSAGGAVTVGCEDGILLYRDGTFTKTASPDGYGRVGTQAGTEESPVVLGDYKVDKDNKAERPTRVTLTDTETGTMRLVDVSSPYTFRSLGRGPGGEALVLCADGTLRVIDPSSGTVTGTIPVVTPWEEPSAWQEARPTLFTQGAFAYVTEPAANTIHKVDLSRGAVVESAVLPRTPNELTGVEG